ncbi:hypothetical protein [Rhodopirellula sp. MGV]|uniref:hypothetical protein n=1 Tax=Rhodopirellula sp. MGV TaxID=2023130 RepID=UPI000B95F3A5|nr:hypothetical protein [Rhodopirellula sp. MGV]OYP33082.1 hypothetical protein CGZ80_18505 [Rhodopirellula sp. MGV]PNY37965.1 hypothetical protein C2E31_05555 [Rhodopirellula baltica]
MTFDDDTIRDNDCEPGPEVTPRLFRQWQAARRGSRMAEEMTNPVWAWLFRGRIDPYHANERYKSWLKKRFGQVDYPSEPRWAGCRLGRTRTELSDGRVFWIAGEHEDFYDPDFFIYNDLIVEHADGTVRIYGYPVSVFCPTDFHTATLIHDEKTVLLIGSIGYSDEREIGHTPLYALDTETLAVKAVDATGDSPGWINSHHATLVDSGSAILVSGGKVMTDDGFLENIDEWSLSLDSFSWTRLTQRKWIRFLVSRTDQAGLHLWQYEMRSFAFNHPGVGFDQFDELAEELGAEPNMEAFGELYRPPVPFQAMKKSASDDDDEWRTTRINVDGLTIRYVHDVDTVAVTVEGDLPKSMSDLIAMDLRKKLALVENAECQIKWIE